MTAAASAQPGDLARRLTAHRRATRRARRSFLTAVGLFSLGALWFAGRLPLPSVVVPLTGGGIVATLVVGLVVLRRRAAVRLQRLGDPAPPLVARATLGQRFALHRRFQRRLYAAWLGPVVAAFLLAPIFYGVLPTSWRQGGQVYMALLALLFVALVPAAVLDSASQRAVSLVCPVCGASLVGLNGLVLDGDRCRDCGLPVAEVAANAAPATISRPDRAAPPRSVDEFTQRHTQLESDNHRDYVVLIPVSVLIMVGSLVWLASNAKAKLSPNATFIPPLAGMLVSTALLIWGAGRWETRARRLGLACPSCDELLVGGARKSTTHDVRTSGACPACGTVLWQTGA